MISTRYPSPYQIRFIKIPSMMVAVALLDEIDVFVEREDDIGTLEAGVIRSDKITRETYRQ